VHEILAFYSDGFPLGVVSCSRALKISRVLIHWNHMMNQIFLKASQAVKSVSYFF